jgi:hypothetical protein
MKKARAFFQELIGGNQAQGDYDQPLETSYITDAEYFNYRSVLKRLLERADQKLISFHPLNFNTLLMPLFSAFIRAEGETYKIVREFADVHINKQCDRRIAQDQSLYGISEITDEAYAHSLIGREQLIFTLALKALIHCTGSIHAFRSIKLPQNTRMSDDQIERYLDKFLHSVFASYQKNSTQANTTTPSQQQALSPA